ncbi:Putative holin, skin element [Bacillus subtilis]|nr:Putative holin, skin element [Bacillus subtilis]
MEETTVFINFETLDLARIYLFGGVKYLDLLLVLSIIDVITGVIKAWKFKKLRSRSAWFGFVRKMLSFLVVIVANIIDTILNLNGVLTFGTVLFYIAMKGFPLRRTWHRSALRFRLPLLTGFM